MKSHRLKDDGKPAFRVDPNAIWSGFGVVDGDRVLKVYVQDTVLQCFARNFKGADHTSVLDEPRHRCKIFKIAAEKYERGCIEPSDIISITDADVA